MVKVRMLKIEAGPEGSYDVGAIRYVEDERALALIDQHAAVEVNDGEAVGPATAAGAKKETASEKRARQQTERDAANKAKAEAEAKKKAEAANVAKGLNPDGSEKK